jgi:hypothetical protein
MPVYLSAAIGKAWRSKKKPSGWNGVDERFEYASDSRTFWIVLMYVKSCVAIDWLLMTSSTVEMMFDQSALGASAPVVGS